MKIKCEYCESVYDDSEGRCPNCGAPAPTTGHTASGTPKTIEELKKYCDDNGFTSERTRFFIGEDYRGAKAFGIYQEGSDFVVYKNKADGSRAVRYRGSDEEYAVRELYMRLQDEVLNQKSHYVARKEREVEDSRSTAGRSTSRSGRAHRGILGGIFSNILEIAVVIWIIASVFAMFRGNHNGYYTYGPTHYYNLDGTWYYYASDYGNWYESYDTPEDLVDNYKDYYDGDSWDSSYGTTDFTRTDYYSDWEDDNNDSSSDSSGWSSSDWDSSSTDWDSDW